ncbi:MAG: hypothetical protein JW751_10070 [Polyangiaceae bacterium]|nr:hypothetical protein [Polyangiaceae bacterium]
MKLLVRCGLLTIFAAASVACTQDEEEETMRTLEQSNAVSFVCVSMDAEQDRGRPIDDCPDFDEDDENRDLFALVTQPQRGEVAVVNLSEDYVIDTDPWIPGTTFLPVGENPVDLVSTPGGVATFVASAGGPFHHAIQAIPSSCITTPGEGDPRPDLALWPACALPSAPGRLAVLVDPPDEEGRLRETCTSEWVAPQDLPRPLAAAVEDTHQAGSGGCEADLRQEVEPPGRRKLAVTLPDIGEVWLLDAQRLLDVVPGAFPACADVALEGVIVLPTTLPDPLPAQNPGDLLGAETCLPPLSYGPAPDTYFSRPAGLDVRDNVLYVGDLGVPVVHRIDVEHPCTPTELPPLLPRSFESPTRVVFTNAVAASPRTTAGGQFVYAVDDTQGNVMVFDVSSGSEDRTPLVRSGMRFAPFEVPDRIAFGSPVKDVEFIFRDLPATNPTTGVAMTGLLCDPNPELEREDPDHPSLEHRPNGEFTEGARPYRLRGTFGFALLANGTIAVVDVEDLDAPCRRPIETHQGREENPMGCRLDPEIQLGDGLYTDDGTAEGVPTVTGEVSCNIVQAHRPRLARPFASTSEAAVSAPSLRTFPQLRSGTGSSLATSQTADGLANPKLLAADFRDGTPAGVYLGTTWYAADDDEYRLDTDPTTAERNTLTFYYREPRAFPASDEVAVTYEGAFLPQRTTGFLAVNADLAGATFLDASAGFCARGVEDLELAVGQAVELGVDVEDQADFARLHADYVQIVSEVPGEDDDYWDGLARACGDADLGTSYYACEAALGTPAEPQPMRDLMIREAYQGSLVVEPRAIDGGDPAAMLELLDCCFGGEALRYVVRAGHQWVVTSAAGGFQHQVTARGGDLRCVRDCNPRRELLGSRVLEIATTAHLEADADSSTERCERGECLACVEDEAGPVAPDSPCVFENITTRFAIYRGQRRSERDMSFSWYFSGGFTPLSASLVVSSASVSPLSMSFLPQIQELVVADGSAQGLIFVSLDDMGVDTSYE